MPQIQMFLAEQLRRYLPVLLYQIRRTESWKQLSAAADKMLAEAANRIFRKK